MWLGEPTIAWWFLGVSLLGAIFTLNAFLPVRRVPALFVPSFFGSWLTAELAGQHIVWQGVATAWFVSAGALASWPGKLGLGITLVSWLGLAILFAEGRKATTVFNEALSELPETTHRRRLPARQVALPFLFRRKEVRVVRNVVFRKVAGRVLKLDVAMPREPGTRRPILMQVHGGAWIIGDKREQGWPLIGHLAANGWVCFNVNYRLSPAATWPDHLEDVKYALAWIREHAEEYGADPSFVACTGGSAGGHLTAMMGLTGNDPEYQRGFEDADTRVQAAIPVYGVFDFTNRSGDQAPTMRTTLLQPWVMKSFFADAREDYERASPLDRVTREAAPFFIVHGVRDTLAPVRDARMFYDTLRERSKAPVYYAELPGAQHAFDIFASPRTARMVDAVLRFLNAMVERARQDVTEPEPDQATDLRASASLGSSSSPPSS
ncbi:MAG: alpha/beta hydrolase [Myxococcota bacterium]